MHPLPLVEHSDDAVIAMLKGGEFAFIVLGSARWHSSIALAELRQIVGEHALPPVVFVDSEDYYQMRWDFVREFKPKIYFKRTLVTDGSPRSDIEGNVTRIPIRPLCFASVWNLDWVPWQERTLDLFCVFGATQVLRGKVKNLVAEVAKESPGCRTLMEVGHPLGYPGYLDALRHSKIVVDHQRMGTDTLRLWEALSAGACVVSDFNLKPHPPLVPGTHYHQYENDMSVAGDAQKLDRLRDILHGLLRDDARTKATAEQGYALVRTQHSAVDHACYFLRESIAATGRKIEGLTL